MISRIRFWSDWLFRDLTARRGKYVIAETPNVPLIIFMVTVVVAVLTNPGFLQRTLFTIAFAAFVYWGWREWRSGRSRFRKLLGLLAIVSVISAVLLFVV